MDKLQKEIAAAAKKTGISSATKLALITPKEAQEDIVPDIEWWDANILPAGKYINADTVNLEDVIGGVTSLVEHPIQTHPAGKTLNVAQCTIPSIVTSYKVAETQLVKSAYKPSGSSSQRLTWFP